MFLNFYALVPAVSLATPEDVENVVIWMFCLTWNTTALIGALRYLSLLQWYTTVLIGGALFAGNAGVLIGVARPTGVGPLRMYYACWLAAASVAALWIAWIANVLIPMMVTHESQQRRKRYANQFLLNPNEVEHVEQLCGGYFPIAAFSHCIEEAAATTPAPVRRRQLPPESSLDFHRRLRAAVLELVQQFEVAVRHGEM